MSTLIDIRDLAKTYQRGKQKVEVLHHINLAIAEGDFLALMGPSGSGKTTLLNLIGGLDSVSAGSITVGDQRIDQLGGGALARQRRTRRCHGVRRGVRSRVAGRVRLIPLHHCRNVRDPVKAARRPYGRDAGLARNLPQCPVLRDQPREVTARARNPRLAGRSARRRIMYAYHCVPYGR